MFLYPDHAKFDRILPKNKIYGNAQISRALRQRFVNEIEEIVWLYTLGTKTIRLPTAHGVAEIQIFQIALKAGDLREDVLRTIDRAIPSLLFFELIFQNQIRFAAAYKRLSEGSSSQPVLGDFYFQTPWFPASTPRQPLPVALDMESLYAQMLRQHMLASSFALRSRPGEALADTVGRGNRIRAMRRECQRLEARLKKEMQFNRKVEINAELRRCRAELANLESAKNLSAQS